MNQNWRGALARRLLLLLAACGLIGLITGQYAWALAIGLGLLGAKGPFRWRCLFWASGGAFFYGLEAALAKSLIEFARTHEGWASDPAFWSILVALLLGSGA